MSGSLIRGIRLDVWAVEVRVQESVPSVSFSPTGDNRAYGFITDRSLMGTKLTPVAIDIETTGFAVDDHVTVAGLVLPLGCRVFCNTAGRELPPDLEQTIRDRIEPHVVLTTHHSEQTLLADMETFVRERLAGDDNCLVAYNGERYRGGFDFPFLRTRTAAQNVAWPFVDLAYADLQPLVETRFNTVVPADGDQEDHTEIADLCGAYEALIGGGLTDIDPFEESSEAVRAFDSGAFDDLLMHNIADILRTQALAEMAEQYCATSDFRLKSLTPPTRDSSLK
jgi:hypothetical protein